MNSLVLGILLFISVSEHVHGVKIQFFQSSKFGGLIYESNSTAKCNNMPADKKNVRIESIKTDTCLMVYYYPNCKADSRKFDLDNNHGWYLKVGSFHICNEGIGGTQLKIDITKWLHHSESDVLESYRDMCCINVPQYVQNMDWWSIKNYGNDFLAYYQPNCSENKWKAEHVPAGNWCKGSRCMHAYEKTDSVTKIKYKIQSIGPDPNSKYFKTSCKSALQRDVLILEQKHEQDSLNLEVRDKQLEKQIETILTDNQVMKNKTAELESKLENQYRSLRDSIDMLKDEFNNLGKNLSTI